MAAAAARREAASVPLVLMAFCQLHLAYGVGSLWGLLTAPLRFRGKRRRTRGSALPDRRD